MNAKILILSFVLPALYSCRYTTNTNGNFSGKNGEVKIIQLNPEHGHAAAAQNDNLKQIDSTVFVYAPEKSNLENYLDNIHSFRARKENPAKWNEVIYTGDDYVDKMVQEKKGNVVVLSGNNRIKMDYIEHSINAGLNVFSDKPMVINIAGFERLKKAYSLAAQNGVLLFDMMTERYNLINKVQRSLMQDTLLFGKLKAGTPDHPAIFESSVHYFYRGGKGNRPAWYFDVEQQGEGMVDVTTHLIDLSFWKAFPNQIIDYRQDVKVISARHSPVFLTRTQFSKATSLPEIPASLNKYRKDSVLEVFANGSIRYQVKGVCAEVKVEWKAETPRDGNDLRNAYAEGTKARLEISQDESQKRLKLCIRNSGKLPEKDFRKNLKRTIDCLQTVYPGISLSDETEFTEIVLPSELEKSGDPTFKVFLSYLVNRDMPEWEIPNTLAKYYITTTALEMAKEEK